MRSIEPESEHKQGKDTVEPAEFTWEALGNIETPTLPHSLPRSTPAFFFTVEYYRVSGMLILLRRRLDTRTRPDRVASIDEQGTNF